MSFIDSHLVSLKNCVFSELVRLLLQTLFQRMLESRRLPIGIFMEASLHRYAFYLGFLEAPTSISIDGLLDSSVRWNDA